MAQQTSSQVRSYGIDFDASTSSEMPYARLAAETYGADFETRRVGAGDARATVGLLSELYDEPLVDYSTIPTYHVSRLAADHVTVVLTGDGGDEVFGGYGRYPAHLRTAERRRRSRGAIPAAAVAFAALLPGLRGLPYAARLAMAERSLYRAPVEGYFRRIGLFDGWELGRLLGPRAKGGLDGLDPLWLFRQFYRADYPDFAALRYLDLKTYLPDDILVKVDRASMACSLEARPPLLDHQLVELAFSVDDGLMLDEHGGKRVLRHAMRHEIPRGVLERSKKGFGSPIRAWLRGGLADEAVGELDTWTIVDSGLLRPEFVRSFVRNGAFNRWAKLWSLVVLESWHRRWIAGVPSDSVVAPKAAAERV
jgi:asparagine synthase (glutamine-hydrolysing)